MMFDTINGNSPYVAKAPPKIRRAGNDEYVRHAYFMEVQ